MNIFPIAVVWIFIFPFYNAKNKELIKLAFACQGYPLDKGSTCFINRAGCDPAHQFAQSCPQAPRRQASSISRTLNWRVHMQQHFHFDSFLLSSSMSHCYARPLALYILYFFIQKSKCIFTMILWGKVLFLLVVKVALYTNCSEI